MTVSLYNSPNHVREEHVTLLKENCGLPPTPSIELTQWWQTIFNTWTNIGLPDDYMLSIAKVTGTEELEYVMCIINQIAL